MYLLSPLFFQHLEPSPERLDAQIRALALNQDTLVKSVLQIHQALLESNKSIVEALEQNTDVVKQLKVKIYFILLTVISHYIKSFLLLKFNFTLSFTGKFDLDFKNSMYK